MKESREIRPMPRAIKMGSVFTIIFFIWTMLVMCIDVQPKGQNGTDIGFATLNCWFHKLIGTNMLLYTITDWMGLVPIFVCVIFASIGFFQLIKRKSLFKVDIDIIVLGVYYIIVIGCYVFFEINKLNYRPVLINGVMETSYPSSTTLLVVTVMLSLIEQINRRMNRNILLRRIIVIAFSLFLIFMVVGRIISGVHWITDIIGSMLFSIGVFNLYKGFVEISCSK